MTDPNIDRNDKVPNANRTVLEWLNGRPEYRRSGAKVVFDCDESADIVEQFKISLQASARK